MASKRMTSLEVIDTDDFLEMQVTTQLLYFHLNARADDDGFVANPKKIIRDSGAKDVDIQFLIAKKYVIPFQEGVCILTHWRINNFIRKDIYKETKYLDIKRSLFIKPEGIYTEIEDENTLPVPNGHFIMDDIKIALTERQRSVNVALTEKNPINTLQNHVNGTSTERQPSIDKIRLEKVSLDGKDFSNEKSEMQNAEEGTTQGLPPEPALPKTLAEFLERKETVEGNATNENTT